MLINKNSLSIFRTEFADAVKALEKKHGIKISLGRITYTANEFRGKMTATNPVTNEGVSTRISGIPEKYRDKINTPFNSGKHNYVLVGWNARSRKYPAIVKRLDNGKEYKMSPWMLGVSF